MDAKGAEKKITSFLSAYFRKTKRKIAVVGLSGGLDSAVTLALCVRALGKNRALAVLLPSPSTPARDLKDAKVLAKKLGVKTVVFSIGPALGPFGYLAKGKL